MKRNASLPGRPGRRPGPPKTTSERRPRILAIDPGTREIGLALLDGKELVYHGVSVIRKRQSAKVIIEEGCRIVRRLIKDFQPDLMVYEKTFIAKSRNVALLNVLTDEIRELARRFGVSVQGIAVGSARKKLCGNGRASKAEVATVVVARYPELKVYLNQVQKWKTRYHANMFDAVALALAADSEGK